MSEIDDILKSAPEHKPGAIPTRYVAQSSEIEQALNDAPAPARGFKGWAQDIGATAVKGTIGVPEAIVGLADIPAGGRVGKFLENEGGAIGFRPKQAKEIVNSWHSDATLSAQRKFQEADGIGGKLLAAIENPSVIATAIGESLPAMGAGGVAARGLMAAKGAFAANAATRAGMGEAAAAKAAEQAATKFAPLAGAAGEGAMMAGSQASAIRQETEDGYLTPTQSGLAAATGLVGGAFGALGGKLANKFGFGDADTMVAQGAKALGDPVAGQSAKSIPKQVIQGAISEGLLEELPQSVTEQILQNLALGKDWSEGVDSAIVMGTLSGGAMGAGAAGLRGMSSRGDSKKDATQGTPSEQGPTPQLGNTTDLQQEDFPAAPEIGKSLTGTDPSALMGRGQGLSGSTDDPLANMIAGQRDNESTSVANIQRATQNRPPMTATNAGNVLVAAKEQGLDLTVAPHPDGGFAIVPRAWVTPQIAAQTEAQLRQTLSRVAQAEDSPVQRAARSSTNAADISLNIDSVEGYIADIRKVNTPASKAFVGEVDAGRITRQDVELRMAIERGKTPDQRLAEAAAQAPAQADPYALKPSQKMGLNSNAGPLSAGAVIAVDTGEHTRVRQDAAMQQAAELAAKAPKPKESVTQGTQTNGTQAPQAKQASPQGPQAPTATDEGLNNVQATAAQTDRTSTQDEGRSAVRGENAPSGDASANSGGNLSGANGVQASSQLTFEKASGGEAWDGMTAEQRKEVAAKSGLPKIVSANVHKAAWDKLNPDTRAKLEAVMGQPESATNVQNPQAPAEGSQAQAAPVEARTDGAGNAATASGVPAAAGAGDVQADGVKPRGVLAKLADQKRAAAIERIAKGTAYFGTNDKADDFIEKSGIGDTHEVVQAKPGRFEIRVKADAVSNMQTADGAAPKETAIDRRNRLKAEKEAASAPGATTLQKAMDLAGWSGETGRNDTIWTKQANKDRYTARLDPSSDSMEITVLVDVVDTQIDSFKVEDPAQAAKQANKAVADDLAQAQSSVNSVQVAKDVAKANGVAGQLAKIATARSGGAEQEKALRKLGFIKNAKDGWTDLTTKGRDHLIGSGYEYSTKSGWVKKPAEQAPVSPAPSKTIAEEPKTDALTEKENAAKAKMFGALGKLAALASKNTRLNWTPEEEQQLLPIVIELFDGAMDLGAVTFQKAVRYVREFIANGLDQKTADSIPFETLQGAYIHTARKFKAQGATSGKEVMNFDSLEELEALEETAEKADDESVSKVDNAETPNQEKQDAAQQLDSPGAGALAGAPAQEVRPAGEGGNAGRGAVQRSGEDRAGNAGADDAGGDAAGGLGNDTGAVPVPTGGTRADAKKPAKRRVSRKAGADAEPGLFGATGGLTPEDGANPAPNAPQIAAPQPTAEDFTLTEDIDLGEGGQKTKFKNNVAAIRLVADLESTGRLATPAEQAVLAKYVGWGGLPQAFDPQNANWAKEYAEITALMSADDLAAARMSTRYAHYTSREIIVDGIYGAMRRFGFNGGKTLEAGAGVGNFIGMMPADMRSAGRFTAIEREPFSSAIARQLYPQQGVVRADFTEFKGNDAYYDAAVGNPPFASDPQTDRSGRKHLSGLSLHNYFFAKSIDMLREGGIMAQVVTNSFLDAKTDKARKYISDRTEFLGAIRLPNSAFSKNANTEVTTDIIFLKKRADADFGGKEAKADAKRWLDIGKFTDKAGKVVALNQYFIDNPEMMLGDFGAHGTMYGPEQPALVARPGQDTLAMLKAAVAKLPGDVYRSIDKGSASIDAAVVALKNPTVKEGGYFMEGGKLMQRMPDIAGEARGVEITPATQWTQKTTLGEAGFERIKALSSMRATVRGLIAAEMADDAKTMKALRTTLNEQYDAYREKHGLINDPSTLRVFDDDPDFPLLASLEHGYTPGIGPSAAKTLGIKPFTSTAKKGPIFTQRVVAARQTVQRVDTPADALAVSMAERGKLDAAYIGQLLGMEPEQVLEELSTGDKPLLFRDPATNEFVLRDAYLSGNVRAKLAQAKASGMFSNINALEAVQPEDVASHEITARLGSPWVPVSVYKDFASSLYGEDASVSVTYLPNNSSYQVLVYNGSDVAMSNTWGTKAYPGDALLQAVMNNRTIKVTYRDSDGKTFTDGPATELANEKAAEIKAKFNDWLFADADRSELLTKAYNETNNNYVTRVYDGANMTFPGKVPDAVIKFRRHQRNAIARIVQDRTALLDHVVGAGKTFTVISGAMELKRTGLARKPMIAVPNHLVKQWAADFYRLYPGANILTATKKDFEKGNRRKFLARIATGDWDAVVIAHSSFGFIQPSAEFEAEFNGREISKIMATIKQVEDADGDKPMKKRTIKQLEGMKERLENRIRSLRDKPMDDLLDFEQIGVDQLFVDEAHMFKNLMYTTKMQGVAGLNDPTGSQRAYDMYVKTNQVMEKNGRGQGVVFATGTPVSNSLAEMYHMMRYLMPAQMKELGFESFDAWANTYAGVDQVWMQAPSGDGFKAQNRMSNFVNTPELLKMFDQVSDTVTMDDIKKAYAEENKGAEFPLPKLKGGRRTPVSLEKSEAQNGYMDLIAKRAQAIEKRKGPPQKGDDNILVVMSDARKAAMDIRLVDPDVTEREKGGRIDRSTDEVVARYRQYDKVKGTQLVFSDLGTPLKHAKKEMVEYEALQARVQAGTPDVSVSATLGDEAAMEIMEDAEAAQAELDAKGRDWLDAVKAAQRGFSIYDDFKAALIEKGVPEAEIAFIHDYNTDDQKASLFRKVNAGQIRVLLGSTAKLGAGTNVQERLVALHHLDVPWRPSDVEQREGRIERQGNRLMTDWPKFEIEILAYVTKDTLDMRMWQVQETKLKMINQLRTRKIGREIDNAFEDMELSAGEMQAAATGDINLLKEIQLRNDVKKLEQRRRAFEGQRNDLLSRKRRNADMLRDLPAKVAAASVDAKFAAQYLSDRYDNRPAFKMNIDGKDYTDVAEAKALLREKDMASEEVTALNGEKTTKKLPLSVTIDGELIKNRATMAELLSNATGDAVPIAWTYKGETYRRRTVLANGIRKAVADSIADESVQPVGTIGAYEVAVEGSTDKGGETVVEVTLSRAGQVAMSASTKGIDPGNAPDWVIKTSENMLSSAVQEADWLDGNLARARKDAIDLGKTEADGDWPDQAKLDAARAAHKDVLALLKKKDEAAPDAADPEDEANFGTKTRSQGTPADRAVMAMAGDGKSADEILRFIANASKSPFNRQIAHLLRRTGVNPAVSIGGDMGGGAGFKFLAKYSRKNHEVTLSEGASDRAEQIFMHEAVHAATLLALDRGGEHADRMKALYESVKKQGLSDAYGMKNVGEFVAEAFTNPEFQKSLKGYKAPGGTAWDRFVAVVRRILGLSDQSQDALSAALELGVEVMRENMPLRKARSFSAEDAPAFAGVDQTETPAFKRWFGDSKVVDSAGKPLVVYHGTGGDFNAFDVGRKTKNYGTFGEFETARAGVFFAEDRRFADEFKPKGGRVIDAYLSLQNPVDLVDGYPNAVFTKLGKVLSDNNLNSISPDGMWELFDDGFPGSQEFVAALKDVGYDGAKIGERDKAGNLREVWIAFRPEQIKSATGNRGTFDPEDADIAHFGMADAVQQIKQFDVKTAPKNTWAHYRGMALQALGRRQIVDLYAEELPQLETYNDLVQQMDAEKNDSGAEADRLAQDWGALEERAMVGIGPAKVAAGPAKYPGMDRKLAELMHDATLAKVDPSKPMPVGFLKGDYDALKARYDALSPAAQKLFGKARDMYRDHYRAVQQAIKDRIERSEMSPSEKKRMMAALDDKLFKELTGVYFPLARFGQYVIVVKDANGEVKNVTRAETVKEAEAARKELQKAFPAHMGNTVGKVLKQAEFNAGRDAVGKGFMADLMGALDEKGVDDELRDTVAQLYLSSLPDLSWAKHGIHRKGTPGFSQDARRAFAQNMFHGARYLAKLRHSDKLQDLLIEMQSHIRAYEGVEEYDSIQAQQVVDEMVKRHEWLMNPNASPVSTALTSFGFLFHMGLSPASAMVNLTQTALVAYPQMGAKWGFDKAGAALIRASGEVVKAKNDLSTALKGDELDAFNQAVKDGTIDVTMAHDLAGLAQGEDQGVMWKVRPVMRAASFMFHHAEKFNRQATFIAAYRLAKEANPEATQQQLYEQAKQATYDGHFDYASANRPRMMQGNWQRVIFLFKTFAQNMVYTLARNAHQSVKGKTPEVRREARRALGGILAAHAAGAGILGLPIVGQLLTAASWLGGDDDEPWDAEVAMQNAMAELLGPKAAEVMAHGLSRLTPFDLSGRVALNKLILPDVQEGLEGKEWAESAMAAALGPVAGIGVNVARGVQKMTDGDYMRGLEDMMPTAIRGPIKALRYGNEGAVDKTGVVITDEVSMAGVLGQASGFAPSQVRRDTERRSAIYGYDRDLTERRSVLMRMFAEAQMNSDTETVQEVRQNIAAFNEKNPTRRITVPNLMQSVRNRQKRIDQAQDGVYLPKNRRDALESVNF